MSFSLLALHSCNKSASSRTSSSDTSGFSSTLLIVEAGAMPNLHWARRQHASLYKDTYKHGLESHKFFFSRELWTMNKPSVLPSSYFETKPRLRGCGKSWWPKGSKYYYACNFNTLRSHTASCSFFLCDNYVLSRKSDWADTCYQELFIKKLVMSHRIWLVHSSSRGLPPSAR